MTKKLKRNLLILLFLLTFGFFPQMVYAATANVNVTTSNLRPVVGNQISVTFRISSSSALGSWQYQISYPSSLFTFQSCSSNALNQVGYVSNNSTKSASVTCYFKAKASGSGKFTINNYNIFGWDEKKMSASISPVNVTVITQQQLEASYSKNNNLKSLSVSGGTLSPAFKNSTTTYSVELPPETKKTKISGEKEDSKASVSGFGEKELNDGLNTFKIVVTAENGSSKTYTLNITVKELEPIEVPMDGQTYHVVRKKDLIQTTPNEAFVPKTILIEEKEVPAFYNEALDYTLVALQDDEGNIAFYIYDASSNTYQKYEEYSFLPLTLEILDSRAEIPENYSPVSVQIADQEVTVYKIDDSSDFALFNARDITTGKEDLYLYDSKQNTVQRYYNLDASLKELENEKQKEFYEYIILALILALVLTYFILLICLIAKERKRQKRIKYMEQEKMLHSKKDELYQEMFQKEDKKEKTKTKETKEVKETNENEEKNDTKEKEDVESSSKEEMKPKKTKKKK